MWFVLKFRENEVKWNSDEDEGGSGGEEVEVDFTLGDHEESGSDYLISREANEGYGKKSDSNIDSNEKSNNDYNDDNLEEIEDPIVKSRVKRMGS